MNMHWVQNAEYKKEYELLIEFEDGSIRLVNLERYLDKGIFVPLKDVDNFKKFQVNHDTDTIEWYNGADLSPEFLYEIGKPVAQTPNVACL
jgi:hypothetical protein